MKICGHISCEDCIQHVVPCPVQGCRCYMDRASSEYLLKYLKKEKVSIVVKLTNTPVLFPVQVESNFSHANLAHYGKEILRLKEESKHYPKWCATSVIALL